MAGGGSLLQHGQLLGDLTIDEGGHAEVYGQICGDVVNNGTLNLFGQVVGNLNGNKSAPTTRIGQIVGGLLSSLLWFVF